MMYNKLLLHVSYALTSAVADFLPQQMTVSLSADQLRACVQVAIIADAIVEPNEVFDVGLTTSTSGVAVRLGREVAQVNILEMSKLIGMLCNTWLQRIQ